jgi:cytochrome c peroxidase
VPATARVGNALAAIPLGLDAVIPAPFGNPITTEKAELGRRLFFDPLLSRDSTTSCASCHRPELAFADERRFSPGVRGRTIERTAPSLSNRGYGRAFFWDGRAASLEEAVLMPIRNPREMDLELPRLLARLASHEKYLRLFASAFPGEPLTEGGVARALSTYLRTVLSGDAPIDRFTAGDTSALADSARRGRRLFLGRAGCSACHGGPTFTDEELHNTGVSWGSADLGRFGVTGEEADRGRFKTPSLRNVARTAPYMHDGSIPTLDAVLEFYFGGGGANPHLDASIRVLDLAAEERRDVIEFLEALTSPSAP